MNVEVIKNIPRYFFHPKPSVDSTLIVIKRGEPIIKKHYKKYHRFVYKWVNKEYRKLLTQNQFQQALKHAKMIDLKVTND